MLSTENVHNICVVHCVLSKDFAGTESMPVNMALNLLVNLG